MAKPYKDLIVDEADGKARYNLVDRAGNVVAADVALHISSPVLQQGDTYGAREMNTFITRSDDGEVLTTNFYVQEDF
ncbi:MAG TPA: hypothetical protein DEB31_01665 [Clostridiales bacterium]|nr:hypothetical protein [Clostridiales bacterium]